MRVAVVGAGAIGASTAYYLAEAGADVTIVERAGVACAASGKSGGFLALDWCDGQPVEALARRSFALHEHLASTLDADWGYRRMTTYAGYEVPGEGSGPVDWTGPVAIMRQLSGPQTTAQVNPAGFTAALADAAQARGARLLRGAVQGVTRGADGRLAGLVVDGAPVPFEAAVFAMGPWSILAAAWLPKLVDDLRLACALLNHDAAALEQLNEQLPRTGSSLHAMLCFTHRLAMRAPPGASQAVPQPHTRCLHRWGPLDQWCQWRCPGGGAR